MAQAAPHAALVLFSLPECGVIGGIASTLVGAHSEPGPGYPPRRSVHRVIEASSAHSPAVEYPRHCTACARSMPIWARLAEY